MLAGPLLEALAWRSKNPPRQSVLPLALKATSSASSPGVSCPAPLVLKTYRHSGLRKRPPEAEGAWVSYEDTLVLPARVDAAVPRARLRGRAPRGGGGRRGPVLTYSREARLRHQRHLARIRPDLMRGEMRLVTLTYPRAWPADDRLVARQLQVFIQRARRHEMRHGRELDLEWVVELQRRGAPHFHLLVWSALPDALLRLVLSRAWRAVIKTHDRHHEVYGVDVRIRRDVLQSQRQLYRYLAKYVTKGGGDVRPFHGRRWGYTGGVRTDPHEVLDVFDAGMDVWLRRIVRRLLVARGARRTARRLRDSGCRHEVFLSHETLEELIVAVAQVRDPSPAGFQRWSREDQLSWIRGHFTLRDRWWRREYVAA